MGPDEPAKHKRHAERGRQAHKNGLGKASNDRHGVDAIEDRRRDHPRQRMEQPHRTEELPGAVRGDVLGERGLKRRAAHAADGGYGPGRDEHVSVLRSRVADVADHVEDDGATDDGEIELVGTGVALRRARGGAADDADDDGEDEDEDAHATGVDDREEDGLVVGVKLEAVPGVDEDDSQGAHGYTEHGGVDGGKKDEVAADGAGGAGPGRPQDGEGRE